VSSLKTRSATELTARAMAIWHRRVAKEVNYESPPGCKLDLCKSAESSLYWRVA